MTEERRTEIPNLSKLLNILKASSTEHMAIKYDNGLYISATATNGIRFDFGGSLTLIAIVYMSPMENPHDPHQFETSLIRVKGCDDDDNRLKMDLKRTNGNYDKVVGIMEAVAKAFLDKVETTENAYMTMLETIHDTVDYNTRVE